MWDRIGIMNGKQNSIQMAKIRTCAANSMYSAILSLLRRCCSAVVYELDSLGGKLSQIRGVSYRYLPRLTVLWRVSFILAISKANWKPERKLWKVSFVDRQEWLSVMGMVNPMTI